MVIAESVTRLAATLIAIVQTRVQLVAAEIEEESLRYFSYLIFSLAAMFCFGVAILLGVMLAVVLFWDSYRVGILLALMVLFGIAGVALSRWVREQYRLKPALLGHSMTELSRDTELLKPPL
jgi:uncharacterized membrane protein YqjE